MFGVLIDVSGSMETAYSLDRSSDDEVERIHALLTTIMNIVKREVAHHDRREDIFASAFGLQGPAQTGDLILMLDYLADREIRRRNDGCVGLEIQHEIKDGYKPLIGLAIQHEAPHAEKWIRNHLSEFEAEILYRGLRFDESMIPKLLELIPSQAATTVTSGIQTTAHVSPAKMLEGMMNFTGLSWFVSPATVTNMFPSNPVANFVDKNVDEAVHRSEAYKLARKIIDCPKARPVQQVSKMIDDLLRSEGSSSMSCSSSLHDRIREIIEPIKPHIYGGTPMCAALNNAKDALMETSTNQKVLFILSDGESGDGDPRPIAEVLRKFDVTIVTCFLTSDPIIEPRRLFDEPDPSWSTRGGRLVLFEMSSCMENTHTPISYLVDANWELPPSGVSRLFIQANRLDVVNEFCKIVVSQMEKDCDALTHILEKVPLAKYINQKIAKIVPPKQEFETCYANAIATVFHLAIHRIVGREGGYPTFEEIRQCLVDAHGTEGADSEKVLEKVCPLYHLHFEEIDETHARQAINERRPVVVTFYLYKKQWDNFRSFYDYTPKGILTKNDVVGEF